MKLIDKLRETFPDNFLYNVYGIVGPLGLTLAWVNPDFSKGLRRFNENDRISIYDYTDAGLIRIAPNPGIGAEGLITVSPDFFKGYIKYSDT